MNTSHPNPMNRPWEQLKAEKAGQYPGYVYIGRGHPQYPLSDIFGKDIWTAGMHTQYKGNCVAMDYWTTEETWNNKIMTTLTQPKTDSKKGETEIYRRFFETKKEKAYAIFEEVIPGEEGTDTVSTVAAPATFLRKTGVRGMFVARRNNKGQIVVGLSRCNPLDSFDKVKGLNIARQNARPYDQVRTGFPGTTLPSKYQADWEKFLRRVKKYFNLED